MANWPDCLCRLGNKALAERKDAYHTTGKGLSYTEQQDALPGKMKADQALRMVHLLGLSTACGYRAILDQG